MEKKCFCCNKMYHTEFLEKLDKTGDYICQVCIKEICNSFSYYIGEEKISKEEYDDYIDNI